MPHDKRSPDSIAACKLFSKRILQSPRMTKSLKNYMIISISFIISTIVQIMYTGLTELKDNRLLHNETVVKKKIQSKIEESAEFDSTVCHVP